MTTGQHLALGIGMMIISLMGLMPPWVHVRVDDPATRSPAGYAFVTIGAPVPPDESETGAGDRGRRFRQTYQGIPLRLWAAEIDGRRLALQWTAVSLATAGAVWLLRRRRRSPAPGPPPRHPG